MEEWLTTRITNDLAPEDERSTNAVMPLGVGALKGRVLQLIVRLAGYNSDDAGASYTAQCWPCYGKSLHCVSSQNGRLIAWRFCHSHTRWQTSNTHNATILNCQCPLHPPHSGLFQGGKWSNNQRKLHKYKSFSFWLPLYASIVHSFCSNAVGKTRITNIDVSVKLHVNSLCVQIYITVPNLGIKLFTYNYTDKLLFYCLLGSRLKHQN